MHIYTCKVLLAGSRNNEVKKHGISAAEVMCLRRIHGDDAVVDIEEGSNKSIEHHKERERLAAKYHHGLLKSKTSFERMFGPDHQSLPTRLPDFEKKTEERKPAHKQHHLPPASKEKVNPAEMVE